MGSGSRLVCLVVALALAACGSPDPTRADGDPSALSGDRADGGGLGDDAVPGEDDGDEGDALGGDGRGGTPLDDDPSSGDEVEVVLDGDQVLLRDADGVERQVLELTESDGELVHAVLRPGRSASVVMLTLFRVEDAEPDLDPRYELRYVVVDEGGASDLYWFPWRLQVDARVAQVLDVAPLPVWSPDGSAVAWIEWNGDQTTLRLVGWRGDDVGSNPSDAVSAFRLPDVEPGTQLESWDGGGIVVLHARGPEGERVEIELDLRHLAMDRADV